MSHKPASIHPGFSKLVLRADKTYELGQNITVSESATHVSGCPVVVSSGRRVAPWSGPNVSPSRLLFPVSPPRTSFAIKHAQTHLPTRPLALVMLLCSWSPYPTPRNCPTNHDLTKPLPTDWPADRPTDMHKFQFTDILSWESGRERNESRVSVKIKSPKWCPHLVSNLRRRIPTPPHPLVTAISQIIS
jgi:hypothetical protein